MAQLFHGLAGDGISSKVGSAPSLLDCKGFLTNTLGFLTHPRMRPLNRAPRSVPAPIPAQRWLYPMARAQRGLHRAFVSRLGNSGPGACAVAGDLLCLIFGPMPHTHTHTQVGDSYRWSPQVYDSCFIHSLHVNRMFYREIERVGVVEVANHLIREPRETHVFSRASWAEKLSNSGCVVSCADALRFLRIFACRVESHVSR